MLVSLRRPSSAVKAWRVAKLAKIGAEGGKVGGGKI